MEGATQCGFCTPGFIVSLTGYALKDNVPALDKAIDAVNGNICRCTGYKSIERAAKLVTDKLVERNTMDAISYAFENNFIPAYFLNIREKILALKSDAEEPVAATADHKYLGGGTDLYVQQPEHMPAKNISFLFDKTETNGICIRDNMIEIGGSATVADMESYSEFNNLFPTLPSIIKLISSTPIRNMATIAGNFTNASTDW